MGFSLQSLTSEDFTANTWPLTLKGPHHVIEAPGSHDASVHCADPSGKSASALCHRHDAGMQP